MPEATFLQIQGRGDPTTRMLELPAGPVRVGRGPHCEVRLGGTDLGDVQCMLRRRGNTWHFQPVGPPGHVWIDGRPADQQRPLAFGVPFRVGEHWLTLRSAENATNDWGSFESPIAVGPGARTVEPAASGAAPTAGERPRTAPAPDEDEERLRRWEARLEQRERWLKDRQEERRWEARWKSAGESIRTRSTPPASPPPVSPRPSPTTSPVSAPKTPFRSHLTPPVARIIEPRKAEPVRRVADPTPRPSSPRVAIRPLADPPVPIRQPMESPIVRIAVRTIPIESKAPSVAKPEPPKAPMTRAMITILPGPLDLTSPPETLTLPEAVGPISTAEASSIISGPAGGVPPIVPDRPDPVAPTDSGAGAFALPSPPGSGEGAGTGTSGDGQGSQFPTLVVRPRPSPQSSPGGRGGQKRPGRRNPPAHPLELDPEVEPRPFEVGPGLEGETIAPLEVARPEVEPIETLGRSAILESSTWTEFLPAASTEPSPPEGPATLPAEAAAAEPEVPRPRRPEAHPLEAPRDIGASRVEWPSARAIFEAQGRRAQPAPQVTKGRHRRSPDPEPTDVLGPAHWTVPLWLGWFPAVLLSVMLGTGGLALAYDWAVEANNANVAIRMALRDDGAPGSTIDLANISRGGWWSSNATHLAAWAMALQRAGDGEDHSEEVRSLVNSARSASQLSARSRFVLEWPESSEPGATPDFSHLGRTRDVVTLVWTGRRLRKAGKLDSAIRAYRSAMEMASKANLEGLDPPTFHEDPQVQRYALPREALLGLVVRAMTEDGEWTREQWSEVLPPSAVCSLVASRVLALEQKRADADRLADLAIKQAESPVSPGLDPAEERAAGAEALAYRGRWTDAAEQYRLAIDQADDDATRRMWWLNLAEVAQRIGDDSARARAIEAAKAPDSADRITRKALQYQQNLPGLVSASPRG